MALLTVYSSREKTKTKSLSGGLVHGDVVMKSKATAPVSLSSKRLYCRLHHCEVVVGHDKDGISDKVRSSRWNKIAWIRHCLKLYDYVIWMDLDTVFVNPDLDMMQFVNPVVDIHFTQDMNPKGLKSTGLNSGFFIMKSSKWTIDYFEKVWAHNDGGKGNSDQNSIKHVFRSIFKNKDPEYLPQLPHVNFLPKAIFNAFPNVQNDYR